MVHDNEKRIFREIVTLSQTLENAIARLEANNTALLDEVTTEEAKISTSLQILEEVDRIKERLRIVKEEYLGLFQPQR